MSGVGEGFQLIDRAEVSGAQGLGAGDPLALESHELRAAARGLHRNRCEPPFRQVVGRGTHIHLPRTEGRAERVEQQLAGGAGLQGGRVRVDVHSGMQACRLLV